VENRKADRVGEIADEESISFRQSDAAVEMPVGSRYQQGEHQSSQEKLGPHGKTLRANNWFKQNSRSSRILEFICRGTTGRTRRLEVMLWTQNEVSQPGCEVASTERY